MYVVRPGAFAQGPSLRLLPARLVGTPLVEPPPEPVQVGHCSVTHYMAGTDASGTTLDTIPFDIEEGDFILVLACYYGSAATTTLATSDSALTFPQHHEFIDPDYTGISMSGFLRASAAKSGAVIRMTLDSAKTYRGLSVFRVRPDSGYKVQCHSFNLEGGSGNGTSVTSPTIDVYGDNLLVFGSIIHAALDSVSSLTIGGSAATEFSPGAWFRTAYRSITENTTGVGLAATLASSVNWAAGVICLKCAEVSSAWNGINFNTAGGYGNDSAYRSSAPAGGVLCTAWVNPPDLSGSYPRSRGNIYPFYLHGSNIEIYVIGCNGQIASAGSFMTVYNFNTTIGVPGTAYGFGDQDMYQSTYPRAHEADFNGQHFYAFWYYDDGANIHWHMWGKLGQAEELLHAEGGTVQNDWTYAEARAALEATGMPHAQALAWTPGNLTEIHVGYGNDTSPTYAFGQTATRVYSKTTQPTIAELETIAANPDADTSAWADWKLEWTGGAAVLTDRSGNGRDLSYSGTLYQGANFAFKAGSSAASIVDAGGIASGEAFGGPVVSPAVSDAGGIAGAAALGAPVVRAVVSPVGIATGEALGSPAAGVQVQAAGIASGEAFGPSVVAAVVSALGIPSAEAFGSPTVGVGSDITGAGGIASAEALGGPEVGAGVAASGIVSSEAFGSPSASAGIEGAGIPSAEAFGGPAIAARVSPASIPSGEALGAPSVAAVIQGAGIASEEAVGAPTLSLSITAGNIPTAEAFGLPYVDSFNGIHGAGGIESGESFGEPSLAAQIVAEGLASVEALGSPALAASISSAGIGTGEAFGLPLVGEPPEPPPAARIATLTTESRSATVIGETRVATARSENRVVSATNETRQATASTESREVEA